jgi:hypothetical protein
MTDLDRDLHIVTILAGDLKDYLLSDTLYWSLSDPGPSNNRYPLGTVGGQMLRLRRLDAARGQLSPEQSQRLDDAAATTHDILNEWIIQREQKVAREIKARLQTWSAFLDDLSADTQRFRSEYATQVEGRAILSMLFPLAGRAADGQGFQARLERLDERLRMVCGPGDFVWDPIFEHGFPRADFPWLYVQARN